jgi:hypothetical protein
MSAFNVPETSLYLRDHFQLVPGSEATWQLIAGASLEEPYDIEKPPSAKGEPPRMMHIWRLKSWDTLYNSMYATSELGWYISLEASIQRESQDFLVDYRAGYGVAKRPKWRPNGTPGYLYRYDTIDLKKTANQFSFLVSLVSFAAEVKARGWSWIWSASSVTGEQRVLSLLWCAPTVDDFRNVLADDTIRRMYANILNDAERSKSRYLFPIATETY